MNAMHDPHELTTGSLRVFVEVAHAGSFTGAAHLLSYTQSAVSRQIAALEGEVGSKLFDRQARGVRPTEAGRRFLVHAEAVLDRIDVALRELIDLRELNIGRLRVGAFATADASLIPDSVAAFRRAHPEISVSLHEAFIAELLELLTNGQIDLAVIRVSADAPEPDGVELRKLADENMFVAVPNKHRCANNKRVRLSDLADEEWIAGSARADETLLAPYLRADFNPRIGFVAKDWIAKQGFVAAGVGITLLPSLAAAAIRPDVTLVALDPQGIPPRQICTATVRGVTPTASTKAFIKVLRSFPFPPQSRTHST
jgi:DNA-binding transcriptional LysR family regulator